MSISVKSILLICTLTSGVAIAADENVEAKEDKASTFAQMFEKSAVSGNLRSMYAGYDQKQAGENNIYATAIGGYLKYELSELNGFSAAAAFATSHDIGFATGDKESKHNDELSSSEGKYSMLSEVYLNYKYDSFNFRAGRQLIDTPLADSDDIRMIFNTFEAYIATYEASGFSVMAGKLEKWQGYDAGLDERWIKTGEDGTLFSGIAYSNDILEANAWYYNISKLTNATYLDAKFTHGITDDFSVSGAAQYLRENEIGNSSTEASIYGLLAEASAYGFTLSAAYNKSEKESGKASFSGFGGGTLFTSMDTMILDEITNDRDARAIVGGIRYEIDNVTTLSYAYGDFDGKADSIGDKAHIVEQNIGLEYNVLKDKFTLSAIYAIEKDKESSAKTENDWNRLQIMASYSF
ncbi:MAG: hypothetical protein WC279_02515 [Sulfurimonas sp.]|jgi:hypothetical protein|uniref:hypothetical protein n=1 Tax=unclassified Sulfurimonas TaxID=2623549 RepID=UPI0008D69667|nr:hypothetical protein [Sulfurimonas sp. RIFOXYB12_FULL_35_9]MBS4067868.1 hypothetical protein [Sulfurimonas sp.]OHE04316.1 MAG: hypothetical protein A2345_04350 [Sulfurimonas sp. RIFOXYB12_FULL_35_9]